MTRQEKVQELEGMKKKIEELVMQYNSSMLEGVPNPTVEVEELNFVGTPTGNKITVYLSELIAENVKEYTAKAREICFDDCKATDDPMLEAVKRYTFPTIAVKVTKKGDEKIPVSEVVETEKAIDLLKLHKSTEGGIGKDPHWNDMLERMNFHMVARTAKDLIKNKDNLEATLKEINGSFAMSKIAKDISMGKDPTSNTKLLATLQSIITAMIGEEYKVISKDVRYLTCLYATKGKKALSVNCANHNHFRGIIAGICHSLVTGKDYSVTSKEMKI